MALFGQQKDSGGIDEVVSMINKGMTSDQIVQELVSKGMTPQQAMALVNQAEVTVGSSSEQQPQQASLQFAPQSGPPPTSMPPPPGGNVMINPQTEQIEEVAEAIISEKWKELVKDFNRLETSRSQIEGRLDKLEVAQEDLKNQFDKLHTALLGKIGEYDQSVVNLEAEIKAMEKIFQKILPAFTDDVAELSQIVGKLKQDKKENS